MKEKKNERKKNGKDNMFHPPPSNAPASATLRGYKNKQCLKMVMTLQDNNKKKDNQVSGGSPPDASRRFDHTACSEVGPSLGSEILYDDHEQSMRHLTAAIASLFLVQRNSK